MLMNETEIIENYEQCGRNKLTEEDECVQGVYVKAKMR